MDYRKLLIKYILHVRSCEGVDFVDSIGPGSWQGGPEWTQEEADIMWGLGRYINDGGH